MENKYNTKIDSDDTMNDVVIVPQSEQHVNPDGETDAQKGAKLGGVSGAVTGALAGSMLGVPGAAVGAAIGGVVGAVTSGLAVAQVDKVDGDSKNDHEVAHEVIAVTEDESNRIKASEKSLYERLGGVFSIAAVIDHFSDAVVLNPIVGKNSQNPALRNWHTENLCRLPGLKFMRTLWVCEITGGSFKFLPTKPGKTHLGLEEAHRNFNISSKEFDEVAAELGRSLDFAKVPAHEKGEVLAAFAAHKNEVTAGSMKITHYEHKEQTQ